MKCEECCEVEVDYEGQWCDECSLPEKQHPFNTSPAYNPDLRSVVSTRNIERVVRK